MKSQGLGGGSCWSYSSESGQWGEADRSVLIHAQWDSVQLEDALTFSILSVQRLCTPLPVRALSAFSLSHFFKKHSMHFLKLGQHPYNVLLNRHSNNWFMLYWITHSCLLRVLVETEGPVSVPSQVNCKWVPTSGLQYAARLHMSTDGRLPVLTVTKQLHTLTQPLPQALRCDSTAEKQKGWAPYGQESQPSKRKRIEPWREFVWQCQEASGMEMGSQPIQHWFAANAVCYINRARGDQTAWNSVMEFKSDPFGALCML